VRPLVNRNAAQTNRNYAMGYDEALVICLQSKKY
jgi:hypothetical protein